MLSLGCSCYVVSTSASDGLEILVSEMTCNVLLCGDVKACSLVHYITEQRCVVYTGALPRCVTHRETVVVVMCVHWCIA